MTDRSLLRDAVDLVLRDVDAVYGPDAVTVALIDEPDALASLAAENRSLLDTLTDPAFGDFSHDVDAWVYVPGDLGAVGLTVLDSGVFEDLVVRAAEVVQEVVMESSTYFGDAFPPCPAHPNHPLWAEVRGSTAVWACASDPSIALPIGGADTGPAS